MRTIEDMYMPYNFSENKTYVFTLNLSEDIYTNILHKLPSYIKTVSGIFVSGISKEREKRFLGIISLCFNGLAYKTFRVPVYDVKYIKDCSQPFPLCEGLRSNSFLQGYFLNADAVVERTAKRSEGSGKDSNTIKIYIHYRL